MEKRFALIGHPVSGSLNPTLIAAAYGGRFGYDLIDEADFERAWDRVTAAYDGFNVTAPFKRRVVEKLLELPGTQLSDSVRAIGCANVVVRDGALWRAYNTDVDGVCGALAEATDGMPHLVQEKGLCCTKEVLATDWYRKGGSCVRNNGQDQPDHPTVLIVGNGGAAMAAKAALSGGCDVYIAARSEGTLRPPYPAADIVVYCLPGSAPVPEGLPLEGAVVLEAEYRTPRLADYNCRRYISGRRWLFHQAVTSYRHFTGEEPDIAAMQRALP